MNRKHALVYVLSAIVLFNVIAIVILHSKTIDDPVQEPMHAAPVAEQPAPIVVKAEKPEVPVLILSADCDDCFDARLYASELGDLLNMKVQDAPPDLFDIPRLPAIAFSDVVEQYQGDFVAGWEFFGTIETIDEGEHAGVWYVLPSLNPPYVDTATGEVKGRVSVTYVTMDSCSECYDVMLNDQFLADSRITPYEKTVVDASTDEGKTLINRYHLTSLPTIIMSPDASEYSNIQPTWEVVGTIENDGSYVLRNLQRLKVVYYDLEEERVMRP